MGECVNCGNDIAEGAIFCSECGTQIIKEGTENRTTESKPPRQITLGLISSYVVGIPTLLLGALLLVVSVGAGLLLLGVGVITIPYSRRKVETSLNITLSRWLVVGVFVVGFVVSPILLLGAGDTVDSDSQYDLQTVKAEATTIPYDELLRNIEDNEGTPVHYRGEVIQVIEQGNDEYTLRVYITEERYGWSDDVYVHWKGDRVIEDDIVQFWGVVEGPKSYKTVLGDQRTIPEITAVDIVLD